MSVLLGAHDICVGARKVRAGSRHEGRYEVSERGRSVSGPGRQPAASSSSSTLFHSGLEECQPSSSWPRRPQPETEGHSRDVVAEAQMAADPADESGLAVHERPHGAAGEPEARAVLIP